MNAQTANLTNPAPKWSDALDVYEPKGGPVRVFIQETINELAAKDREIAMLRKDTVDFGSWVAGKMLQPEWDSFKKSLEVIDHWKIRAEKAEARVKELEAHHG